MLWAQWLLLALLLGLIGCCFLSRRTNGDIVIEGDWRPAIALCSLAALLWAAGAFSHILGAP